MSPGDFLRAVLAVLAGFIGIRKRERAEADENNIRPAHIIIAGLFAVAGFIALLLLIVRSVTQS